eukprot:7004472-Prymnesium_polylepis.1
MAGAGAGAAAGAPTKSSATSSKALSSGGPTLARIRVASSSLNGTTSPSCGRRWQHLTAARVAKGSARAKRREHAGSSAERKRRAAARRGWICAWSCLGALLVEQLDDRLHGVAVVSPDGDAQHRLRLVARRLRRTRSKSQPPCWPDSGDLLRLLYDC